MCEVSQKLKHLCIQWKGLGPDVLYNADATAKEASHPVPPKLPFSMLGRKTSGTATLLRSFKFLKENCLS